MQTKKWIISLTLFIASIHSAQAQDHQEETKSKRYIVGSSLFMLGNFLPEEKPDFVQLNVGYLITSRDVISLELKTWRYFEPLGIPYGEARTNPKENFPGFIREKGFAIAYQRFWWKGLYTGIHVMNAWQSFTNESGNRFDGGFQIFNTYRTGYHIKLFDNKFFLEPSIAITHRPFHTRMPESFEVQDDKWPKIFIGEPGLHFGYKF